MPVNFKISDDGMFVHTVAEGKVTNEDLLSYAEKLLSSTELKPRYKELFDGTMATSIEVDKEGVDGILQVDQNHRNAVAGSKCAIVVADKEAFELAEYYERLAKEYFIDVIVFNTLLTARTWLGIGEEQPI